MIALGPHAAFIIGAYLAAFAVVATLILWVIADHRALTRQLRSLEEKGLRRRSAPSHGGSV